MPDPDFNCSVFTFKRQSVTNVQGQIFVVRISAHRPQISATRKTILKVHLWQGLSVTGQDPFRALCAV